jgi:hypothetical protein
MVETARIRQVIWFVMLKSVKDRVIGVDTPGQLVQPRVRYGMACLLIRDAVRSVPCLDEWEIGVVTRLGSHGARGAVVPVIPRSEIAGTKPPYVCPGCFIYTYSNNMINRFHVQ